MVYKPQGKKPQVSGILVKYCFCLLLFGFVVLENQAQNFVPGKGINWLLDKPNEPRLKLKFWTTGINIGGYEGTTLILENVTSAKLLVEVNLTITDFCNVSKIRTIELVINPHSKIGGSTWMGGSEQYDYSTTCAEKKKYDASFSTRIFSVTLEIISVKDLTEGAAQSNGGASSGGEHGNTDAGSGTNGNGVNGNGTQNKPCPTYGFKLSNTPSYNCVALEWWSLSTQTNSVDAGGNFKQSTDPQAKYFTIEYRKQGDINWTTDRSENSGRNVHTLTGLYACTKYEVRLITTCDNNQVSAPTNIVRFTTACNKPGKLSVENITSNSAKVSSQRLTAAITYPCSGLASTQIRIIEYKTSSSSWSDVICNSGSPCSLYALSPNTIYRVRARYEYGINLYSDYTNEISFTTKP